MPTYRRRFTTSIAKVNARSIDGFFGEGTPCFFIRGTILSDTQVDGEYRTLSIQRPGNVLEIEDFDGEWATLVITTRSGNRPGDNLRARMVLKDSDLRSVGVDCERIMAGLGTFVAPENPAFVDETSAPVVAPPPPPPSAPAPPPPRPVAANGFRKPTLDFDHIADPEPLAAVPEAPAPIEREPEPEPEPVAAVVPEETFVPAADVLIVP